MSYLSFRIPIVYLLQESFTNRELTERQKNHYILVSKNNRYSEPGTCVIDI